MKKTFLVLIAAIAAASSIQATEVPQPIDTPRFVISQERLDYMVSRLASVAAEEISKSAPKAGHTKTIASDVRAKAKAETASQTTKTVGTSS